MARPPLHRAPKERDAALYRAVGRRVTHYRKARGLTQSELARRIEAERSSVCELESGRHRWPLHRLLDVAEVLGVRLADLLPESPERLPPPPPETRSWAEMAALLERLEAKLDAQTPAAT